MPLFLRSCYFFETMTTNTGMMTGTISMLFSIRLYKYNFNLAVVSCYLSIMDGTLVSLCALCYH